MRSVGRIFTFIASALLVACTATDARDDNPENTLPRNAAIENISRASTAATTVTRDTQRGSPDAAASAELAALSDPLRIHVLNIGAGSCQLVECPGSSDVLVVDCGQMAPTASDMSAEHIAQYFSDVIGNGSTIVTLSHPDADHINRIVTAMGARKPQSLWLGGDINEYGGNVATWISKLDADNVDIFFGFEPGFNNGGQPVPELQCGNAQTYILAVNVGGSRNSQSVVLLVEFGAFRAIFSGDAEGSTELAAIDAFGALIQDTTLLLGSHHGAATHGSNSSGWATEVAPQIVAFSAGRSHGHPNNGAAEVYRASLFPTATHAFRTAESKNHPYEEFDSVQAEYVTELSGTILVESDGTWVWLECSLLPGCF